MAAGTIATEASDQRVKGIQCPVARIQTTQVDWVTGEGNDAQTAEVFISGTIYRMDVIISAVTGNADLTVSVACADDNGCAFGNELNHSGLAHSSSHYFDSQSSGDDDADFNPVAHHGDITVTITPNEDTGGTAQTLAVDVIFYVRQ